MLHDLEPRKISNSRNNNDHKFNRLLHNDNYWVEYDNCRYKKNYNTLFWENKSELECL